MLAGSQPGTVAFVRDIQAPPLLVLWQLVGDTTVAGPVAIPVAMTKQSERVHHWSRLEQGVGGSETNRAFSNVPRHLGRMGTTTAT